MDAPTRLVVLSDLHLSHTQSDDTANAAATLIGAHSGLEIVLAGDVFSLSNDPPSRDPVESVKSVFSSYPRFAAAVRAHLAGGAKLTLMAGNHDAALGDPRLRDALLSKLELRADAELDVVRWFVRRGNVHLEHGHLWDPDNAPAHPLAPCSPQSEPLGIALTRRFVARHAAWQFAHAHETTVAEGLARAFRVFGVGAPLLVQRYFAAASAICLETLLDRGISEERAQGEGLVSSTATSSGLDESHVRALLRAAPTPTHTRFSDTFLRLYFDRVLAAAGTAVGAGWCLLAPGPYAATLAAASAAFLLVNVKFSGARYQNRPVRFLRSGAELVREITQAKLVIFGHTHVPLNEAHYANSGSFGYPGERGRPYLLVDPQGSAELLYR
jgi:predicted phosphodiesterase